MRDNKLIQVLWVENDPMITSAYPREAEMVAGIELCPFPCWKEAESALEEDYKRWDAIILDAKCRYEKDDADKADRFLVNVFRRIEKLAERNKRTIPWYVLSGQGEDDIRDLIPVDNEWDNDWMRIANRRFYSKNGKVMWKGKEEDERRVLFDRIKTYVTYHCPELSIEYNLYPDVFTALDRLDLADAVGFHLMPLLIPIHFGDTSNDDYNRRYVDLRKALEHLFCDMVEKGILPPIVIRKSPKENVNLSWSSLFLGASQPDNIDNLAESEKKFWEKVERKTDTPLLPKQFGQWLKAAVFQTGGAVHTSTEREEIAMNLDNYLPHVGGSPYMLRALAMGLCDFILWYDNFVKDHPDKKMNAEKYWRLKNS